MGDTVVDQLLEEVAAGSDGSKQRLIEAVYQDLRRIAKAQVGRGSGRDGTIGATALVHEAWLRLAGRPWHGRAGIWRWQGHFKNFTMLEEPPMSGG